MIASLKWTFELKTVLYLSIAGLVLVAGGCAQAQVRGSGNVVTENRTVSGITGVEFRGDWQLFIEETGTESLSVTADDNILPYLRSEVRAGRLVIQDKDQTNLTPTGSVIFRLTVKNLDSIELSGDGSVEAKGIRSDVLRINLSGDGRMTIDGEADRQDVRLSGDGRFDGERFTGKEGRVHLSGDGRVTVAVTDKLDVDLSGDGSVEYLGNPALTQHLSGDGSIRKR
jgi:hypothetical protein